MLLQCSDYTFETTVKRLLLQNHYSPEDGRPGAGQRAWLNRVTSKSDPDPSKLRAELLPLRSSDTELVNVYPENM